MKKYKLHCFVRPHLIEKGEVYRNRLGWPICKGCLEDELMDEWEDEAIDQIIDEVKTKFNGNYQKWLKNLNNEYQLCEICDHYAPNQQIEIIEGRKYCGSCYDHYLDEKKVLN